MFSSTVLIDAVVHDIDISGFGWALILSTILYTVLGFVLFTLFAVVTNLLFKLDIRKEPVKNDNVGVGVAITGLAIVTAIITMETTSSRCPTRKRLVQGIPPSLRPRRLSSPAIWYAS